MTVSLILAAGSSSRMGEPKMLLRYKGKTFLQHIVDELKPLNNTSIVVVTGFYHALLQPLLQVQNITTFKNDHWQNGMGSSISAGINYIIQQHPSAENVLILTCDQPFVSTALFKQMMDVKESSGKAIVACAYGNTVGIPALFDKNYFSLLLALKDNQGAKKIVVKAMKEVAIVDFQGGVFDIDEPGDYERLLQNPE